jgi:hypothetical protein
MQFDWSHEVVRLGGVDTIVKVAQMRLCHSRLCLVQVFALERQEMMLEGIRRAFHFFGGVPRRLIVDNLKAAVSKADWYDPELNPKIEEFGRYYGTVFLPTRPYTPRHKGKIESGIKYVKNNALKGRRFDSLAEENKHLIWWEKTVADCRIHGTTREQVKKLFEEQEKQTLLPLPAMLFPCFQEGQRSVHRDSYVEVAKAYYQVPEEYIGRRVWVRWDTRLVRIFNLRFEQIAVLSRIPPGKFST